MLFLKAMLKPKQFIYKKVPFKQLLTRFDLMNNNTLNTPPRFIHFYASNTPVRHREQSPQTNYSLMID